MDDKVITEIELSELEDRIEFGICGGSEDVNRETGGGICDLPETTCLPY